MASTAASRRFVPFEEARATVLARARLGPIEVVSLDDSLGRTLREEIVADEPIPGFRNSAMDGFAVRAADVAGATETAPVALVVLETVAAGAVPTLPVGAGEATRIMTGAPVPEGADAVVPVERTAAGVAPAAGGARGAGAAGGILITRAVTAGENVRPVGEDVAIGERLLPVGIEIGAGEIAILAALGHSTVEVAREPRVAILSTGDELVQPGEPLRPGTIRDSNTHTLRAFVRAAGAGVGPCWHLADDPHAVPMAVRRALSACDVVVTVGGISAGDFDVVRQSLAELGDVELWQVGMRPGQPQAFGEVEGRLFFCLPGNPVSSAVVFEMLVRPALWAMLGRAQLERPRARAVMAEAAGSKAGRRDFLRVRLEELGPGAPAPYRARLTGSQSSGALSSIHKADGLAVIPEAWERVEVGQVVEVVMWKGGWGV